MGLPKLLTQGLCTMKIYGPNDDVQSCNYSIGRQEVLTLAALLLIKQNPTIISGPQKSPSRPLTLLII